MASKKGATAEEDTIPKNSLARHQFFELLVIIAIDKFGSLGEYIKPDVAVERLIRGLILPSFTKNKMFMNPGEIKTWIFDELMPDRDAQKLLFLNQFALKKIYDKLCGEANRLDEPEKVEKTIRRRSTRRMAARKATLTSMNSIAEEPESMSASFKSKSPTMPRKKGSASLLSPARTS